MSHEEIVIREVVESDDFDEIYRLLYETHTRNMDPSLKKKLNYGVSSQFQREKYCGSKNDKGFIAEINGEIVAFIGVSPSKVTKNGVVDIGFTKGKESVIPELFQRCEEVVRKEGGTKIYKFVNTKFGQVRNKEISFYEKFGFISDEFTHATTTLSLNDWECPNNFDSSRIEPVRDLDRDDILNMLLSDGEDSMAELFSDQFLPNKPLDQVILSLHDEQSNEIAGIAYYRVILSNKGSNNEFLDASAFDVHFRPKFELDYSEKRRFIQGALKSMKELNIKHVVTRLTLKNFDTFAVMIREGFHNRDLENVNAIRLYKNV